MNLVGLSYSLFLGEEDRGLTEGDLERVIKISDGLKNARESIKEEYPETGVTVVFVKSKGGEYLVYLRGEETELRSAAETLIEMAGIPDRVYRGCDLIGNILGQYGRKIRRNIFGLFLGNKVVKIPRKTQR
ncbi:hypothetical protein J4430_01615 [Candidatus Woesearchaeota archaeon]|nr:hypothetical protein [Candidatus Woesearchaeota archaeon]